MMLIRYVLASLGLRGTPRQQRGATLIEYVLIVAVIAITVFAVDSFGLVSAITGMFSKAATTITSAGT